MNVINESMDDPSKNKVMRDLEATIAKSDGRYEVDFPWNCILEKMMPAFSHKNFRIREEVLLCLQETVSTFGTQGLSLIKFMPLIAKLLGDPNSQVRDTAFQTLVCIYMHVGEKVRMDLGKKYDIPAAKLQALFTKFDEIRNTGQLLPTASLEIEKMMPAFSHKNFRIREEVLLCLQETVSTFGTQGLSLIKFMPLIAKLLGDPNSQVRDTAFQTLVCIYMHVGEKVRMDLGKKYDIPAAKLQALFTKFDEIRNTGQLLPTASLEIGESFLFVQFSSRFGTQGLSLIKFMPLIAKLLGDPNSQVRDTAFQTLVCIYMHVGEKVRMDLGKKYDIPAAKLQALFTKFDEIRNTGQLLPTASLEIGDAVPRLASLGPTKWHAPRGPRGLSLSVCVLPI
ncbi:CLIP-associating protein 1 [Ixodes scapularis]